MTYRIIADTESRYIGRIIDMTDFDGHLVIDDKVFLIDKVLIIDDNNLTLYNPNYTFKVKKHG